jgi:hypothetical protein
MPFLSPPTLWPEPQVSISRNPNIHSRNHKGFVGAVAFLHGGIAKHLNRLSAKAA